MKPTFVLIRTSSLTQAQEEVLRSFNQLGEVAVGKLIEGVAIGTAETAIAHGLEQVPTAVFAELRADARWWRSKAPDATFVYLKASAAVTATIWVF